MSITPRTRFTVRVAMLLATLTVTSHAYAQDAWRRLDGPYGGGVSSLAIDRQDRLFAATRYEIYRSVDKGQSWHAIDVPIAGLTTTRLWSTPGGNLLALSYSPFPHTDALHRSTDGGESWTSAETGMPDSLAAEYASFATDSSTSTIFLALGVGLYRSNDDGRSWQLTWDIHVSDMSAEHGDLYATGESLDLYRLSASEGYARVAIPIEPGLGVVSVVVNDRRELYAAHHTGFYPRGVRKTTDDGVTWTRVDTSLDFAPALVRHPRGGILAIDSYLYRLSDDRLRWNAVSTIFPYGISDIRFASDGTMYAASNKGVLRSEDGKRWDPINTGITAQYTSYIDAIGDTIVIATGNGLYWSHNRGESWRLIENWMERYYPDAIPALSADGTLYLATRIDNRSELRSTTDFGLTWRALAPVSDRPGSVLSLIATPSLIVAQTSFGLFASTDHGASWINAPVPTGIYPAAIGIDSNGAIIATHYTTFLATTDFGATWMQSSLTAPSRGLYVAPNGDIYSHDASFLDRSRSGYEFERLYRFDWATSIRGVVVDGQGGIILSAQSLLRSTDDGASWQTYMDGMQYAHQQLVASGGSRRLYAAVNGAGIYTRDVDLAGAITSPTAGVSDCIELVSATHTSIALATARRSHARVTAHDILGREIAVAHDGALDAGHHVLSWNGNTAPEGSYFVRVASGECQDVMQVVIAR